MINAVLAGPQAPAEDWLLVHVTQEDASMAILRGQHLAFFRNRAADAEGSLADMVHQTAMYYEDRLSGAGFGPRGARRRADYLPQTAARMPITCAARSNSGSTPGSTPSIREAPQP